MMHPEILSISLFWFVTAYTPGPNNVVASYSGFNFGIKKTIPHILGVTLGFTSLVIFLSIGLINVFKLFPIIQIETKREFYDYHAKYIDENTTFTFPSFEKEFLEYIHSIVKEAFCVIGCTGWGRVDFFINNNKEIELIEINSIPGMTNHSLVPMSAEKNNLDFIKLLEKILFNS